MVGTQKPGTSRGAGPGSMGKIKHLYYKLNLSIFQQVLPLVTPEEMAVLVVLLCQEARP